MSASRNKGESRALDPLQGGLVHNPFAALRPPGAGEAAPSADTPAQPGPASDPVDEAEILAGPIVVSLERKGHGGKSVVRIEGLHADAAGLKALARELGRALGRGARRDGKVVVVQGAELEGPLRWLEQQGARRVIRGTR